MSVAARDRTYGGLAVAESSLATVGRASRSGDWRRGEDRREESRLLASRAESGAVRFREARAASTTRNLGGGEAHTRATGGSTGRALGGGEDVGQRAPGCRKSSWLGAATLTTVRAEQTGVTLICRGEVLVEGMRLREPPPPPPLRAEISISGALAPWTMGSCWRAAATSKDKPAGVERDVDKDKPGVALKASWAPLPTREREGGLSAHATFTTASGVFRGVGERSIELLRATCTTATGAGRGDGERSIELLLLTAASGLPQGGCEFGERWPHSMNSWRLRRDARLQLSEESGTSELDRRLSGEPLRTPVDGPMRRGVGLVAVLALVGGGDVTRRGTVMSRCGDASRVI